MAAGRWRSTIVLVVHHTYSRTVRSSRAAAIVYHARQAGPSFQSRTELFCHHFK
jgi:hypothetical protein